MRAARAREPWLSCSTAATTISLKRRPISSGFSGSVTTRRIAAVGARVAGQRACSSGVGGAETDQGGTDRPSVRNDLGGRDVDPELRSLSRAARSSPSVRAAMAATERICDRRTSRRSALAPGSARAAAPPTSAAPAAAAARLAPPPTRPRRDGSRPLRPEQPSPPGASTARGARSGARVRAGARRVRDRFLAAAIARRHGVAGEAALPPQDLDRAPPGRSPSCRGVRGSGARELAVRRRTEAEDEGLRAPRGTAGADPSGRAGTGPSRGSSRRRGRGSPRPAPASRSETARSSRPGSRSPRGRPDSRGGG